MQKPDVRPEVLKGGQLRSLLDEQAGSQLGWGPLSAVVGTHQCHAQEGHARVRELVVPQHQGRKPLPLLLETLTDVGQT